MKKPKFLEKIKTEAVVASLLLVFLIGCGLVFISGNENTSDAFALSGTQPVANYDQPANETPGSGEPVCYTYTTWNSGSGGYWYLVKVPGTLMTYIPGEYRTYFVSELSDTVVNAADNNSESSDNGSIQIIDGNDGEITLLDDNGEDIDWNDLPEDVKQDLMRLFPELFDDISDQISDNNETGENNETDDDSGLYDYPEADEEDLNLSDVDYGDEGGFADDFDDEINPGENQTDESQNQTENQTPDNSQDPGQNETDQNDTGVIDTENDEVGQVEEVNPLEDEEEFPEEMPDDMPDQDWINDWVNG